MKTTKELEALNDDELRVMLAKLCGWKKLATPEPLLWKRDGQTHIVGYAPWRGPDTRLKHEADLPNYPGDLNATAAVKATLTKFQKEVFIDILDGAKTAKTDPRQYIGYIEAAPLEIFDTFNNVSARKECIALILTLQTNE